MIEVGRLVMKIAGRDAGKKGIILDIIDDKFVLIDGETRRRKVNIFHVEPLGQVVKIGKNASHDDVAKAMDELGMKARNTKPKQKTQRPIKKRKTPEQIRAQKEEKRKLGSVFKPKKKETKTEKGTLEEKAVLAKEEHKHEHVHEQKSEIKAKDKKPVANKSEKK